jgi:hypothetical protein
MYCQRLVVVTEFTYLGVKLGSSEEWGRKTESMKVHSILAFVTATDV